MAETWLKCSACKNPIPYNATHWVCSVSTCNRKAHAARVLHGVVLGQPRRDAAPPRCVGRREARAEQGRVGARARRESAGPRPRRRPSARAESHRSSAASSARRRAAPAPRRPSPRRRRSSQLADAERDVLIVVSKLKKYIKDRSGFNCSDAVADMLTEHVRAICDEAIRAAARDERKTVLDRDVPRPLRR